MIKKNLPKNERMRYFATISFITSIGAVIGLFALNNIGIGLIYAMGVIPMAIILVSPAGGNESPCGNPEKTPPVS